MDVQLCLDALRRRHREQRLSHARREARQRRAGPGHLPLRVGKEPLVLIEGDESYAPRATTPSASASPPTRAMQCSALQCRDDIRMPALAELPMMSVVQPAYHCGPNGGQGSFLPSARRRLSCVLVFATVYEFCAGKGHRVSSRIDPSSHPPTHSPIRVSWSSRRLFAGQLEHGTARPIRLYVPSPARFIPLWRGASVVMRVWIRGRRTYTRRDM